MALEVLGQYYAAERPELAAQLAAVRPISRENTGGGFFTKLAVDSTVGPPLELLGPLGEHYAPIDGLEHGIGLLLFHDKSGYLSCLEGYSQGPESTIDLDFTTVGFGAIGLINFVRG